MKLIFIGSGSAFTVGADNYNSNMLLVDETNNQKLLIDCGSDARHALHEAGYSYRDITDVYISHLHADHAGGLEWLALTTKFDPACEKPNLFANRFIIKDLWHNTLSGGMNTLQGIKSQLSLFFNVHPVEENSSFIWNNTRFQIIQTVHVVSGFMLMHSFGLIFEVNNKKIFITTDTQFSPNQLKDFYRSADLIFQDCETTSVPSGVHAHYDQLITLEPSIKEKMWLYHYNPGKLPNAVKDGMCGFVSKKQIFDL